MNRSFHGEVLLYVDRKLNPSRRVFRVGIYVVAAPTFFGMPTSTDYFQTDHATLESIHKNVIVPLIFSFILLLNFGTKDKYHELIEI